MHRALKPFGLSRTQALAGRKLAAVSSGRPVRKIPEGGLAARPRPPLSESISSEMQVPSFEANQLKYWRSLESGHPPSRCTRFCWQASCKGKGEAGKESGDGSLQKAATRLAVLKLSSEMKPMFAVWQLGKSLTSDSACKAAKRFSDYTHKIPQAGSHL